MNTHDKIELPPLPPADRYFEFDSHRMKASIDVPYWGEKSLEAYALAAIEADRKRRIPPDEPFAIVIDRLYDGEGPSLAYWNGENYQFTDGDCYEREGDTLDGYTAEFLTDYQLEERLFDDRQRSVEPVGWPKVNGVGRVIGSEQSLEIYFDSEPSDDQLRAVHDVLAPTQPDEPVKPKADHLNLDRLADYISDNWPDKKYDLEEICQRLHATWPTAFMPAEPVKKKYWNVELSSWSDEDFVQVFHECPDLANRLRKMLAEPVKHKRPYAQGTALGEFGVIPMCDQVDDEPVKVSNMTTKTDTERERAEFEEWFEDDRGHPARKNDGTYSPFASGCWRAWRARAALQSQDKADAERLDWLLRNLTGDAIRYCVGVIADTSDIDEFREAIDHARRIEGDKHE